MVFAKCAMVFWFGKNYQLLNKSGRWRNLAARLERSSFCEEERQAKKRERKAEIAAQIKFFNLKIRLRN